MLRLPAVSSLLLASGAALCAVCCNGCSTGPAQIGPNGGTVTSADGRVTLTVPAGALQQGVSIGITPVPSDSVPAASGFVPGTAYDLTPDGITLSAPATLTVRYDSGRVPTGLADALLRIEQVGSGSWVLVPDGRVRVSAATATAPIRRLTTYGVVESGLEPAATVDGGSHFTCALNVAGAAFCWGQNADGELGDGTQQASTTPVPVAGGLAFTTLEVGDDAACGLADDGTAYCWGRSMARQDSAVAITAPQAIPGLKFTALDVGLRFACGIGTDALAYCWGWNPDGQLGDDTSGVDSPTPVLVKTDQRFVQVTAGALQACGLTADGAAYCWGSNLEGELGANVSLTAVASTPLAVNAPASFVTLQASGLLTCGEMTGGTVECWGYNGFGGLGIGAFTPVSSAVPVQVAGGLAFTSVAADGENTIVAHACGLTDAGVAYCWGGDEFGELGYDPPQQCTYSTSTFGCSDTPMAVEGGRQFFTLDTGLQHTCGVTVEGAVYCWGSNASGELGNGTTTPSTIPVRVVPVGTPGALPVAPVPPVPRAALTANAGLIRPE